MRARAAEEFDRELRAALAGTVWHSGCTNWYVDENGNDPNQWPPPALRQGSEERPDQLGILRQRVLARHQHQLVVAWDPGLLDPDDLGSGPRRRSWSS